MRSKKIWMTFLFVFLYTTIGAGAENEQKEKFKNAINYLSKRVAQKYKLSTTGYQTAMLKKGTFITPERAKEYTAKAKETFPFETLKNMAILQSNYINRIPETDQLGDPHHMNETQLTSCLWRCRAINFANCEMQSVEVGIHLYALGFKKFKIWSNKALSHNYIVLEPITFFPKGAVVDAWTGFELRELDGSMIFKYKHVKDNLMIDQNMMDWLDKNATTYANKEWISEIRTKFYPGQGPTPLDFIQ